ncbi:hypothetical protein RJ640_002040 [Escallonia rubra]|uniref:Uncharacterized protein n=1 Tax=Escallonia rubra TaxID=112253 RepID=A0AA88UP59_9ASTE|nr:hypothetical protein RJ640_002040 [Escallonia rubra]
MLVCRVALVGFGRHGGAAGGERLVSSLRNDSFSFQLALPFPLTKRLYVLDLWRYAAAVMEDFYGLWVARMMAGCMTFSRIGVEEPWRGVLALPAVAGAADWNDGDGQLDSTAVMRVSAQELVFVENPALMGSLSGHMSNITSLRRVVLTGTGVSGKVPDGFGDLVNLEQLTLSRNRFSGEVLLDFSKLKKLKVLDLSQNGFEGNISESVGGLTGLLKLDLSFNKFSGKITESLKGLRGRK